MNNISTTILLLLPLKNQFYGVAVALGAIVMVTHWPPRKVQMKERCQDK